MKPGANEFMSQIQARKYLNVWYSPTQTLAPQKNTKIIEYANCTLNVNIESLYFALR